MTSIEDTMDAIEWEKRVLADAALRLEEVLVELFGQPIDGSLLSQAHIGLRIALRNPGRLYDWLHDHPDLMKLRNPVPPLELEREGRDYRDAMDSDWVAEMFE